MAWTKDHDSILCGEILTMEPFKFAKRSSERGEVWREISANLNALSNPKFKVNQRSVRDRFTLIQTKYKEKNRMEERATGIDCEPETELDRAIAEIIAKEKEADKNREEKAGNLSKKNEQDKTNAEDVRRKAMESLGKRNADSDSNDSKPKKSRKKSSDAVEYLREKLEAEKSLRQEEIELKRNEQKIMFEQMKLMQGQNKAIFTLLEKKL